MRRLHLLNYDQYMNSVDINMYTTNASVLSESQLAEILNALNNPDSEVDDALNRMMEAIDNSYNSVNPEDLEPQEPVVTESQESQPEPIEEERPPQEPLLPENSKTILMNEFTSRFTSAIWYDRIRTMSVTLAGLGGIGSYIGFLLSRLQVRSLNLYDPDTVEAVNMSGQMYPISSIGSAKTSALIDIIRNYSNFYNYRTYTKRYEADDPAGPIMICGFDNMEARKVFFNNWLFYVKNSRVDPKTCLFIDGRLAAEEFQILSIQGDDERAIKEYQEKWLFSDDEAEATICSYKQTTFMANMIASMMVNVFVNFAANLSDPAPIIPRDIPFFISYSADTMFTKIEM